MSKLVLISWNINGRTATNTAQAEFLLSRHPDLICLQEVRPKARDNLVTWFTKHGYAYSSESVTDALNVGRTKGNLTISRIPHAKIESQDYRLPFSDSLILTRCRGSKGPIDLYNAHIPNGSKNGWKKIETFEILRTMLAANKATRILCGDFNSPMAELPSGQVIPFVGRVAASSKGGFQSLTAEQRKEKWGKAELGIIKGLSDLGMYDVFRAIHGYIKQDYSYFISRNGETKKSLRFDHIFSSSDLTPYRCDYLHEARLANLSDHSPIEAEFRL